MKVLINIISGMMIFFGICIIMIKGEYSSTTEVVMSLLIKVIGFVFCYFGFLIKSKMVVSKPKHN